jgi:beta-phosphoglucomutase-like phosphatase (HAD superfamily)
MIEAVVFDLDGLLIDSEHVWDEARRQFVVERGGRWHDRAQREMMGMSSPEWSSYLHDELGVDLPARGISEEVVRRLEAL